MLDAVQGIPQRVCPGCRRNVAGRNARCFYCGAAMEAPEPRPPRYCPRCSSTMEEVIANWVAIDRCPRCQGEFYERGEMDGCLKLDDKGIRWLSENLMPHVKLATGTTPTPLACPGCASPMRAFIVRVASEFEIDVCGRCKGTWLDRGEPTSLKRAISDGLLSVAVTPSAVGHVSPWNATTADRSSLLAATSWTLADLALEIVVDAAIEGIFDS